MDKLDSFYRYCNNASTKSKLVYFYFQYLFANAPENPSPLSRDELTEYYHLIRDNLNRLDEVAEDDLEFATVFQEKFLQLQPPVGYMGGEAVRYDSRGERMVVSDRLDDFSAQQPYYPDHIIPETGLEEYVDPDSYNASRLHVPEFTLPAPVPSAYDVLPGALFRRDESLGDVSKRLTQALEASGYGRQLSYFAVPEGFAILTGVERIQRNYYGNLDNSSRWLGRVSTVNRKFDLSTFLSQLATQEAGEYRVMAFVFNNDPFPPNLKPMGEEETDIWVRHGERGGLPRQISRQRFDGYYYCTVLVYEFEVSDNPKALVQHIPGDRTVRQHLEEAGLWTQLEL